MFDFQKLEVYHKALHFCKTLSGLLHSEIIDKVTRDQLRRASFSIMLNIAEGSSRFSNKDRKNFLVIARGSAFECTAIMDYLVEMKEVTPTEYNDYVSLLDELSRMLFGLIRRLE